MKNRSDIELHLKTPCFLSLPMSRIANTLVWLKVEALQPSGSFKNRGMGRLCREYREHGAKCFVSSSGGNAGLAVAYAGRMLGVVVKVVVPKTTSPYMREKISREGAEVIVSGKNWNESDPVARKMAEEEGAFYIHPFDDPLVWEGNATLIKEVAEDGIKPDAVVLSVGGGGLFCGVAEGMRQVGWDNVPIVAVETEGAASFAAALKKGEVVALPDIRTIAVSLGATKVSEKALDWSRRRPVISRVVSDKDALGASLRFAEDHRILVEPACGATLSLIYEQMPVLKDFKTILAVVCGGSGVSFDLIDKWKKDTGMA